MCSLLPTPPPFLLFLPLLPMPKGKTPWGPSYHLQAREKHDPTANPEGTLVIPSSLWNGDNCFLFFKLCGPCYFVPTNQADRDRLKHRSMPSRFGEKQGGQWGQTEWEQAKVVEVRSERTQESDYMGLEGLICHSSICGELLQSTRGAGDITGNKTLRY